MEVLPLSRASDAAPRIAERFELSITRREYATGFSELNDADDLAARFHAPVANEDVGHEEAMFLDAEFSQASPCKRLPAGGSDVAIRAVGPLNVLRSRHC